MAKRKTSDPNQTQIKRLFKAIQEGDEAVIDDFLDTYPKKVDVKGIGNACFLDKTPLMFALQCGNDELASHLIDRGANVNAKMSGGPRYSVLYFAVYRNVQTDIDFVARLFAEGSEPNVFCTSGFTPLHQVVNNASRYDLESLDSIRLVNLFLDNGADPDTLRQSDRKRRMTARESAQKSSDRLPQEICELLGIGKSTHEPKAKSCDNSQDETLIYHPDGTYRTAYQALRAAVQIVFDQELSGWVAISVHGNPQGNVGKTLWFKNRLLTFPYRFVTPELISGCRNTFSADLIRPGAKRKCQFTESANPAKIAALIESIAKHHDKLKQERGDFGIEVCIDTEFSL